MAVGSYLFPLVHECCSPNFHRIFFDMLYIK